MNIDNQSKNPIEENDSSMNSYEEFKEESFFDLKSIYKILKKRKRIFLFSSLFTFSIFIIYSGFERLVNPTYGGSFKILINDPITKKNFPFRDLGTKPDAIFDYIARNTETLSNDIPTLIEYLKSETILNEIANKFNIQYNSLNKNLSVYIAKNDTKTFEEPPQVLNVFLNYKNPKLGLEILKQTSETYLKASLKLRQKRLSEGLQFLDLQEPELKNNTAKLRNDIAIFRQTNNLLDPNQEALTLKSRLNNLDDLILKLESEEERLKIIENAVRNGNLVSSGLEISENEGKLGGGLGLFITDSNQNILKELVELKKLYAEYLTKYLPSSDLVLGIEKRIEFLEPIVLKKQLESVKSALELKAGTIDAVKKQRKDLNDVFLKQPKYISDYQALEKKLELALEKEKALVKARENFQLEITQRNIPWLILKQPSFEKKPIKPNILNNLFIGLIVSTILGIVIVIFKDILENEFNDSEEVQKVFKEKILSDIPFFNNLKDNKSSISNKIDSFLNYKISSKNNPNRNYEFFYYQEAIRNLYTSLVFDLSDSKFKILALTSAIFGEGKSLINSMLAKIFSENNFRVLLIDADLRKPSIHDNFKLENKFGLSNLLSSENFELKRFSNKINSNLTIIPSGPTNLDPTKILSSPNMNKFINNLRDSNEYDLVIFDVPPSLGLSDYKLISKYTDGLIFLVSIGYCKKFFSIKSYQDIQKLNLKILGIITNSLDKRISGEQFNPIYKYYEKGYSKARKEDSKFYEIKNKKFAKLISIKNALLRWLDG